MSWTARSPFSAAALEANRDRRLTPAQTERLQKLAKSDRFTNVLVGAALIGVAIFFSLIFDLPTWAAWLIPLVCIPFGVVTLIKGTHLGNPLERDLRHPVLGLLEGDVRRTVDRSDGSSNTAPSYYLHISGQRISIEQDEYEAAPSGGRFRAYVLPRSGHLVNLEYLGAD